MASLSSEIHNNGVSGLHSFIILQNIHILRNMLLAQVCTLKTEQYFECVFNVFMLIHTTDVRCTTYITDAQNRHILLN